VRSSLVAECRGEVFPHRGGESFGGSVARASNDHCRPLDLGEIVSHHDVDHVEVTLTLFTLKPA
jgi:hypothetical protein